MWEIIVQIPLICVKFCRPNEAAELKVVSKDIDRIVLTLNPPTDNGKCTPEKFRVEYSASGREPFMEEVYEPADLKVQSAKENVSYRMASNINLDLPISSRMV